MLSYGGISLRTATPQFASWLHATMTPDSAFSFYRPRMLSTPELNPRTGLNWFLSRGVRLNTYFNPWGASRWGIGYFLVDQTALDAIRLLVYADDGYTALPLVMDDGLDNTLTTDLYMLPAVPITGGPLDDDDPTTALYLLVLVDERYFWWERAAAITMTEGTTTWAQMYAAIASGLGITLTTDTISANYLKPSGGLERAYQHLPLLLDWCASSVGQRVVRTLDGDIIARSATAAKTLMDDQETTYIRVAGGRITLDANADTTANVPEAVGVAFPRNDQGPADTAHYFVSKSLAALALTDYDGLVGHPGTHIVHSSAIAQYSSGINPDNEVELKALAGQVATDFYLWRLAALEIRYRTICPWTADGMHDVEWQHGATISTAVMRSMWDDGIGELKHSGTYESSDAITCKCVTDCFGNTSYLRAPKTWWSSTPCDTPVIDGDCSPCSAYSCYSVRFAGIANGTACTDCSTIFDTDISLMRTAPGAFEWDSEIINCTELLPDSYLIVALQRVGGCYFQVKVVLVIGGVSGTFYVLNTYGGNLGADCTGGTLTSVNGTTDAFNICTNWPATITVSVCSGSGSGAPTGISITGLGTSSSGGSPTSILTIPSVSAPSGLLVVLASAIGTGGPSSSVMAAAFNGTSPDGSVSKAFYAASQLYAYYWHLTGATTGDITLSVPAGKTAHIQAALLTIDGLVDNALDASGTASGTGAAPSAAATTATADTAILAAFGVVNAGGTTFTYNGGFTSGLQDVQDLLSVGVYDNLTEGRQIASATGTYTAGFASIDVLTAWGGLVVAFK